MKTKITTIILTLVALATVFAGGLGSVTVGQTPVQVLDSAARRQWVLLQNNSSNAPA